MINYIYAPKENWSNFFCLPDPLWGEFTPPSSHIFHGYYDIINFLYGNIREEDAFVDAYFEMDFFSVD